MRRFTFVAPLAALIVAGAVQAQPAGVSVDIGPRLQDEVSKLGEREVGEQVFQLTAAIRQALADNAELKDAQIHLVLTDLKPNRPTFQQMSDKPGLDPIHSRSIGGLAVEGEIIKADGQRIPVRYSRFNSSIQDVRGFTTWQEASVGYDRFARNLASGRYVSR